MLEKAKNHPFKELLCRNVEEPLGFDHLFHAAICVGVFDFIRHKAGLIKEVCRNLIPGSPFGLTLPEDGPAITFVNSYVNIFAKCGFMVARHERFFGYSDSKTAEDVYYHGFLLIKI
jgi:hypothetical protein